MSLMSKFESKRSKSLDFIAYSVFKDFNKKIFIPRATFHPKMVIYFERKPHRSMNFFKSVSYMYMLQVK